LSVVSQPAAAIGRQFIELGADIAAAIVVTIRAGWTRALASPQVHPEASEVPMTERLRDGMRAALATLPWRKAMIVAAGMESRSIPELAWPDGRTDIPIIIIEVFLRIGEHEPHGIIECKRIADNDARLCREYVVNGIDRFRDSLYASNHAAAFMAGFVLMGSAASAAARVNRYLIRRNRDNECLVLPGMLEHDTEVWASRHERIGTKPIALHHCFLSLGRSSAAETGPADQQCK
jgi:hypothetical protein